jgi:polyisoprenoid-binding protein YceI
MKLLTAAVALLLLCPRAQAAPRTFTLDAERSELVAQLRPDGLFGFVLHAHVIQAREVSGTITWDAEAPESSQAEVRVKAASLVNDAPALRKKYGLHGELSEGDIKTVNQNMKKHDQLDAEKFPELTFTSTAVERTAEGALLLRGQITIHGVTREVTLPITVKEEQGLLRATGKLVVRHDEFGMPAMGLLFLFSNHQEIQLHLSLVATPSEPAPVQPTPVVEETP